jgi:uncharacterized membrane protein YeaQ/YmgE (transglycosylase-associated protein family)
MVSDASPVQELFFYRCASRRPPAARTVDDHDRPQVWTVRPWEHSRGLTPSQGANVLGLISAIVVGLIIGALGRLVLPGRQDIPIWLTIVIGIVAALIGSLIASALGVGDTRGIDWIKLIIQVALAAAGVALVAGRYAPGRRRL